MVYYNDMTEIGYSIDKLPEKNYSGKDKRVIFTIPGFSAGVGYIDSEDSITMKRFRDLMNKAGDHEDDGLDDEFRTDGQLKEMADGIIKRVPPEEMLRFAVTSTDQEKVGAEETGELLGYIRFMPGESDTIEQLTKYDPIYENKPYVYDIAYKRLNEAPQGQKLVSGALRVACLQVRRMVAEVERSKRVIEVEKRMRAGLPEINIPKYRDTDTIVIAYVDQDREVAAEASRRVLRSVGFSQKGNWINDGKYEDERWVLDWEKFEENRNKKYDPSIDNKNDLQRAEKILARHLFKKKQLRQSGKMTPPEPEAG
ncbi:MAG: hypothetical protein UV73_C0010G0004 [Candidatus Gottesmanbacteria bacterium GW2011_GWA2_43_14]|uniref:Uncharacterized protein n=1 Tax=Candidatus Gottesmanbacteria bacterium GW2011_GWA2_43_14 TaxID=1618443 RepID=A0A0G1DFK1_9BACT|nr:MAG: hypothetical protein UV73_C0010G0004 [Candidatus Gottesmanbacteria bacterium GW2011_GWA2_43_14]